MQEQKQRIEELEGDGKLLEEEIKALKESQRKTNDLATKAQEENSRLTFRLAQLTGSYDKVVQELVRELLRCRNKLIGSVCLCVGEELM